MPRRNRLAARILVIDPNNRLLMFRFTPDDRPPLWATAGGEVDPGESFSEAARRELREETGIDADPGVVVAERESDFITFAGEPVHAVEKYFVVYVVSQKIDQSGHTTSEQAVMRHHEWWSMGDLLCTDEDVFPDDLESIFRRVIGASRATRL